MNPQTTRSGNAHFERIMIPPDQSLQWRLDDYPWERSVWNYHPEFEIHLIRHSSGLAYVGDYIGNFDAGHLVLVGSNLPHNWITPSIGDQRLAERDIVVQFEPERILAVSDRLPEISEIEPLFRRAALGIEFFGKTAATGAAILEAMAQTAGLGRLAMLLDLLSQLGRSTESRILATPQFLDHFRPANSTDQEILDKALDFIRKNFLKRPSLSDVAGLVGLSDSAFSRFFKAQTGNTYSDHIASLRIWTARKLLAETERAITDICFEAGFNNISNFNRKFLASVGMTPSEYRKAAARRSLPG